MFKSSLTVALTLSLQACDTECIVPPCLAPIALEVTVGPIAGGGTVSGASLTVSGAESLTVPCASGCFVVGPAGSYRLTLSAPGYLPAEKDVVVHGTTPPCGCTMVETERVSFTLTTAAPPEG